MPRQITILVYLFLLSGVHAQNVGIDFLHGKIQVIPKPESSEINGEVTYSFSTRGIADSIFIDARKMEIQDVWIENEPVKWNYNGEQIKVSAPQLVGNYFIKIRYVAKPKQALYFIGWQHPLNGREQIWTQGQGKYSSNWVPSFDAMTEKISFDISVSFHKNYSVVANGELKGVTLSDSLKVWEFEMKQPMSSYLLALAIGKLDSVNHISRSGVPLTLYYPSGEWKRARNTYRLNNEIFDFLEQEIGVRYPWQMYKQVPVRDFMYAGMENTGLTLFDDSYLVDSIGIRDLDYFEINAHELAHQWFGNLVTETGASEHWLHEGFATFYAYKTTEAFLGNEYITWKLYKTFLELSELDRNGGGASLLNPEAGSLVFYEKGAWAFLALQELVGDKTFRIGVKSYLENFAFGSATVDDFLKIMEHVGGISLVDFKEEWLISDKFPTESALKILRDRSNSFEYFWNMTRGDRIKENPTADFLKIVWDAYANPEYRAAILEVFFDKFDSELLTIAIESEDIPIQKIILSHSPDIASDKRINLFTFLDAKSYEVRYQALLRLWLNENDNKSNILDKISENGSLNDQKINQLWLALAILTTGYLDDSQREHTVHELIKSTSSRFNWSIRQHGFELLYEIKRLNRESLVNLIEGTEHHAWQFRIYCRRLLDRMLLEIPEYNFWNEFSGDFSENSFPYFYSKLNQL